ncbi:prephenate dehydrogenase [Pseudobacillus wudalianchiensis]|uniref:Prephenate dehydrogenase n=1 Tax=Pseudobacillus wudalianchiensis TaxID=1743143 RepID=A0A1B9B9I0_9BACI|nr:prephenate dehydrogenase [Bacillus wudalianchiensis]OCA92756.1 prephenate dehydrogenase [Bacillus wudalianchiensis]
MRGTVLVAGMGLIGGSLAKAIKAAHPQAEIIGYDIREDEVGLAEALNIIDKKAESFQQGAEQADLIVLAVPVLQTEKLINELAEFTLKEEVIITDTGSTKKRIMSCAAILEDRQITFIGGHPMAGSHKSGVAAAKELLFENAFYLLTPGEGANEKQIAVLKKWLQGTKAKIIEISADDHDRLTGVVSHFPHVIAASLVHQARKYNNSNSLISRLAAGGFRDLTRIASSNPEMWKDISLHNKDVLLTLLHDWKIEMERVIEVLEEESEPLLFDYFNEAKEFRDDLPAKAMGAIPSFYDLYVDVPDYPGVISEVTAYLAEERISITNIRIMETREDVYGVLVISFQNERDRKRAQQCIEKQTNYDLFLA